MIDVNIKFLVCNILLDSLLQLDISASDLGANSSLQLLDGIHFVAAGERSQGWSLPLHGGVKLLFK